MLEGAKKILTLASCCWNLQRRRRDKKIIDQYWPLAASVFAPGSNQEEILKGKVLSIVDASHYEKLDDYMDNTPTR